MNQQEERHDQIVRAFEREQIRIVGLCGYLTSDYTVAEDLAQETFVEAWRHINRLNEPSGVDRWLSAIARNVCLRWRSRQAKEAKHVLSTPARTGSEDLQLNHLPSTDSVEFDLEREELSNLLDQALVYLPDSTRHALLARYLAESPYKEIASQLQISEGAVKMRVKRGRVAIARLLTDDLQGQSSVFVPPDVNSRGCSGATNLWCSTCGNRKLEGYFDAAAGDLTLHCPTCRPTLGLHESQTYGVPDLFQGIDDIDQAYAQLITRAGAYLWRSLDQERAQCTQCGSDACVIRRLPESGPLRTYDWRGVQIRCETCGHISWASLNGLLMSLPEIQHFRRDHPRIRTLREQRVETGGQPALVIRFESQTDSQQATAVVARDSFRVLELDISAI